MAHALARAQAPPDDPRWAQALQEAVHATGLPLLTEGERGHAARKSIA